MIFRVFLALALLFDVASVAEARTHPVPSWDSGAYWKAAPTPKKRSRVKPKPKTVVKHGRMGLAAPAGLASSINPNVPVTGAALASAPIRSNFVAAYNDLNSLFSYIDNPTTFLTAGTGIAIGATGTISVTSTVGLPATATALQMLQSGASTTPTWSTATWPVTTTANQLLYSSANNTVSNLATANNGTLITNGSGVPFVGTGAQATALLSAFVGDSGSGGTQGVVLAPSAGDATASKFLNAGGTWVAAARQSPIKKQAISTSGATQAINIASGEYVILTLNNSVTTLTISGWPTDGTVGKCTIEVRNTGAFNITNWSGALWAGGTLPTVTSGAGKKDIFTIISGDGGTTTYGNTVGQSFQ